MGGKDGFLLDADDAFEEDVAGAVGLLGVDDGDVGAVGGDAGERFAGEGAGDEADVRIDVGEADAEIAAEESARHTGGAGRVGVGHGGMTMFFKGEGVGPAVFDGVAKAVEGADAGITAPGKDEFGGAAGADHLVVDEVGGHADESEIATPLADDFVGGGEGDEMGEAFEGNRIAVVDKGFDGGGQREERGHCAINARLCVIRYYTPGGQRSQGGAPSVRLSATLSLHMTFPEGDPDFVLSLARGLQVIEAFSGARGGLTVSEAATKTGLSRAATRRLLITLEELGYTERRGAAFQLTSRVLRLGFSFVASNSVAALAVPVLEQLSAQIHESCSVSVLDGEDIVYLARSAPKRVMTIDLGAGSRLPAYCTSMGRVMLAALPKKELDAYLKKVELKALTPKTVRGRKRLQALIGEARERGYALVDEELELGLRSIAVPVVSQTGRVAAAMNSGVHAARVSERELRERVLPLLQDHARLLGQMLP